MSPKAEELLEAVLTLPVQEQLEFVDAIMAGNSPAVPQFDPSFLAEFRRRSAEIDQGKTRFYSWKEVKQSGRLVIEGQTDG